MANEGAQIVADRVDRAAVRRSVWRYALVLLALQGGVALLLARQLGSARLAWVYLAGALVWTAAISAVLDARSALLYTAAGSPVRGLNLATRVTLLRVLCIPLLVTLILAGRPFAAFCLFLGAALTDWLDGFLARRMNDVTQLGRLIDPSIDAMICGFTFLSLGLTGRLPVWVAALVLLRYAVLLVGAGLLKLSLGFLPIMPTFAGRALYVVQYGLLALVLLLHRWEGEVWLIRILGLVQVPFILQLSLLGRGLYREHANGD